MNSLEMTHNYLNTLRIILPLLQKHNIESVEVRFDGSGDSGAIDDIVFTPAETSELKTITVQYQTSGREFSDGNWQWVTTDSTGSLEKAIEVLTYDFLETTHVDWYNNEGGFGELVIDVVKGTVSLDVNVRILETQSEFSSEFIINSGEEI